MNTTEQQVYNTLSVSEKKVYDFCIKMGDNHRLAMQSVEIERKKNGFYSSEEWEMAHIAMIN